MIRETAYAKINLALHVRHRRPDGYHAIETIFMFAADGDLLTAAPGDDLALELTGPFAQGLGGDEDNLVLRAARALAVRFAVRSGARLVLDKRLPVASGLGGGSADAAAALRALVRLWGIDAPLADLHALAAALGSDVPSCLDARPVRGEDRGETLMPVDAGALAGMPLLLVNPGVAMPTGPVFSAWDGIDRGPLAGGDPLAAALSGRNDLQPPAIAIAPAIATMLDWMQQQPGVVLARMSGSGASLFALFSDTGDRDRADAAFAATFPGCWSLATRLR